MKENRKITGYKCIKSFPGCKINTVINGGDVHLKYQKASTETEYFEPIYEEKFKVGDYVVITKSGHGSTDVGHISQLYNIKETNSCYSSFEDRSFAILSPKSIYTAVGDNSYRKATPEEIEQATQIKFGKYPVEFINQEYFAGDTKVVKVGCGEYNRKEIENLAWVFNLKNVEYIGFAEGVKVTLEDVNKVLNKLNNK